MKNSIVYIVGIVAALVFTFVFLINSVGKQPVLIDESGELLYGNIDSENQFSYKTSAEENDVKAPEIQKNEQPEIIEPEPVINKVSFLATGDNLIHSTVFKDAALIAQGTEQEYNFIPMYDNIREDVQKADLAFINQEGPIAGAELGYKGYPNFNAPNQVGDALVDVGFDIINLANNHMLDKGEKGYIGSLDFWDSKPGITAIGGYNNIDDYEDFDIIEKNGIKIAFISFTYGTNGMTIPAASPLYVPIYTKEEIARMSLKARESADVVIASIHWGHEDWFEPNDEQKEYAQIFADCNVDVVLGHHSHTLQPIEWKDRPDGGKTLVAYSLGNLLSGMMYSRNMLGCLLTFDIVKIENQPAYIENVAVTPTMCHYNNSVRGFKLYKFSEYNSELASLHGCKRYENKISMEYLNGIIDKTISEEFLAREIKTQVQPNENTEKAA